MRRTVRTLAALLLVAGVAACGGGDDDDEATVGAGGDDSPATTVTTEASSPVETDEPAEAEGEICRLLSPDDVAAAAGIPLTAQTGSTHPNSPDPWDQCLYFPGERHGPDGLSITLKEWDSPEKAQEVFEYAHGVNAPVPVEGIGDAAVVHDESNAGGEAGARFGAYVLDIDVGAAVQATVRPNAEQLLRTVADAVQPLIA